jgi:hypothetical protein
LEDFGAVCHIGNAFSLATVCELMTRSSHFLTTGCNWSRRW